MTKKIKIIRTATVAMSLNILLKGQLKFLNEEFEVVAVSGQDAHLNEVENRENVKTLSLKMERKIHLINDFISLIKMCGLLKREKPQIVHSITPKAGLITMLAAKIIGVPVRIHTFTGLVFPSRNGFLKQILVWMDKLICYCATDVIAEGNGVKQDLIKFKISSKPIEIIANGNVNGVDLNYYNTEIIQSNIKKIKSELNLENDFVFVFVGRITKEKGIEELILAFEKLNLIYNNVSLLLIGDFEDKHLLNKKVINEIVNNPKIISLGFKDDIRPYVALSNILVLPSYREGFPNVVLQASALGIPSIVTDINGSNEIIKNGINGYICQSKDINSLFEKKELAVKNKIHLKLLGENAKLEVCKKFSNQLVWQELLKFYKNRL